MDSVQQQEEDLAGRSVRSFSVALHPQKLQVAGSADLRTIGLFTCHLFLLCLDHLFDHIATDRTVLGGSQVAVITIA